ncbi:MAG: SPOR domain-containing protein [Treponema sp.]|nr:SPOR domain-containing protein [Treponema sp.]
MEKRKLLLVAISVGIFLVISIMTAIFLLPPRNALGPNPMEMASNPNIPNGFLTISPVEQIDPVELVRRETPGLQQAPEGTINNSVSLHVSADQSRPGETVISVRQPASTPTPADRTTATTPPVTTPPARTPAAPARTPAAPAAQTAPAASTPTASTPAASATQTAPPAQTTPPPATTVAPTSLHNDYWVQTGAFSTVGIAEGVRETLASSGITAIIENRVIDGNTVFRVRVGPYNSQNEANYWLTLIRSIRGFEESQVRVTQSIR